MIKKGIKFDIKGSTAFFKRPEVNTINFTFSHIHKPVILGLLGSIIGLDGLRQQENEDYPQYYLKLKDLKISIEPHKSYFTKKIHTYNNTVGYASKEQGNILNIREQWLENVGWTIYILEDNIEEYEKIKEFLLDSKSVYNLYLGRKEHIASIDNVKEIELKDSIEDVSRIYSIFPENIIKEIDDEAEDDDIDYYLREYLPVNYDEKCNYIYEKLCHTNYEIFELKTTNNIYKFNNKVLYFI